MKKKRIIEKLVLILIILLAVCAGKVNAAEMSPSLYFGITELKNNMGYSIGDPSTNGTTGSAAKIWNIVKYSSESSNDPTDTNVYCVKAGVGFASGSGTKSKQEYNVKYDMYTERTTIASQNDILNKLVNGGYYNHLLALANLLYIPGESTATERANLLSAAGIDEEDYGDGEQYQITDDEIESVQQAALWYFTNHGEDNGKYDQTGKDGSWLYYTTDGTTYESLKSYNPTNEIPSQSAGLDRQKQAGLLYEYLIKTATANASQYANGNGVHKNQLTLYAATKNNQAQPLMEVKKSAGKFDLALRKYITKINGTEVTNSRVPSIDIAKLKAGTETTATYKHRKDPEMVETGATVTYKLTVYNEGEIAGRATKIVDQLPTGLKYSKVNTAGYTASYDEGTNRLTLTKTGTNNLEAFNGTDLKSETIEIECKVEAIGANQILTNVAWIAEEVDENGTTIITEKGKDRDSEPGTTPTVNKDNMEKYKGNTSNKDDLTDSSYFYKGEQDDDDFEKLRVKQITGSYNIELEKVDSKNNVTKLNGAEFSWKLPGSAETKTGTTANGKITLGTVSITDTANKDEITVTEKKAPEGYKKLIDSVTVEITKGTSNGSYVATGVNIKAGGTTGTEVKLSENTITITVPNEKKEFDLALRKYITKINGTEVTNSRVPSIDIAKLKAGTETTATYKHRKDPEMVETGATVTYKLTVYNEGEIAGRATKIVDQLPTGLKYSKVNTAGYTASYDEGTNRLTLTKTGTNNLEAFNGTDLKSETIEIECKVEAIGANQILTNVAWIAEEVDENGTTIITEKGKDRDSEPGTTPTVNKDNMEKYKGNTSNKDDLTDSSYFYKGEQDDDDFEKLRVKQITGSYNIELEKVDSKNNVTKLNGAEFSWKLPGSAETKTGTTANGKITLGTVSITDTANKDEITVTEKKAPEGYKKLIDSVTVEITKGTSNGSYVATGVNIKAGGTTGTEVKLSENTITITVPNEKKEFDLALRKYITKINGTEVTNSRVPSIDIAKLKAGTETTATYKHRKDPEMVETGATVTYKLTVYNEGEIAGRATKIVDQLPTGLKYSKVNTAGYTASYDEGTNRLTLTKTGTNNLEAFNGTDLKSETIEIECKVEAIGANQILTNVAWIAEEVDENGTTIITEKGKDRDSEPGTTPTVNKDNMEKYKGNTSNKDDLTDSSYFYKGEQDDDDFEKLRVKQITGSYNIELEKVDSKNNVTKLNGAEFSWKLPGSAETKTGTTANGKITLGTVSITDTANKDEITVTEKKAPEGYKKLIDSVTVEITKGTSNGSYVATGVNIKTGGTTGTEVKLSGNTITITVPNEKLKEFDLALRKYITKVNEKEYNREPQVNISKLNKTDSEGNKITTAEYNHTKQPILVDTENIVVYTLRIYNEGELDGYANEITDYLPEELEFVKDNEINKNYEWTVSEDGRTVKTGYLSKEKEISDRNNLIKAFDGNTLQYKEVKIAVKVKSNTIANKKLTNIAEITKEVDKDGNNVTDRDSQPSNVNLPNDTDLPSYKDDEINKNYVPGQQDDDDFEKIQVREITGNYQLKLEKIDSQNNTTKLDGAEFSWKLPGSTETKTGTTANGTIDLGTVNITDITNKDEITITETKAPEGYKKLIDSLKIEITKEKLNGGFVAKDVSITSGGIDGTKVTIEGNIITITVPNEKLKEFDLALRKFITKVDDKNYDRAPKVDLSGLKTGTTAIYNHTKQPITVNKNSKIVYTIRVYNESELDGYAQEVTDYLPEGLEYLPTDEINIQYEWNISSDNRKVTTQYLSKEKETSQRQNKIKAFDGTTLSYKDVQIACKVKDSVNAGVKLTNMAEITKDYNEDNIHDKDSSTNNVNVPDDKDLPSYKDDEINKDYVPGQEDDDDFEKVVVKEFDLALRKFITKVDKQDVTTRIPEVK
ncbi:MAG: SpaA isopeptide-forming pilin-related protein, partial [Clostridia bacterium]